MPIRIGVDHPMEPEHFIRWLDLRVDRDPVSWKGRFHFTPGNGQPWVSLSMRSGAGGAIRVEGECSRHGRFAGSRALRVAEGGCTTGPDPTERERMGHPVLRLARAPRPGEVVEVRAKVDHPSQTGLSLRDGKFVRDAPELYIRQVLVYVDDRPISDFQLSAAVSANPLIRFPLRAPPSGTLRVVFVSNEGRRWEASQRIPS